MTTPLTVEEWLQIGIDAGWCSMVVCGTHDGVPSTEETAERWEDGYDPCEPIVRLVPAGEHLWRPDRHGVPS